MKVNGQDYPDNPIFSINKDANGRKFYNLYVNKPSDSVIAVGKTNEVFTGNPKIVIRTGESVYNHQLIVQMLDAKQTQSYVKNTPYNTIEIFLPFNKEMIELFELLIAEAKKEWGENHG